MGRACALTAVALVVGVVLPLAVVASTWELRGAAGVLVLAVIVRSGWSGFRRASTARGLFWLGAALALVAATLPLAGRSERIAVPAAETRAGQRLAALNDPQRALQHFDRAVRLDADNRAARAVAAAGHLGVAERAVAGGMSIASYTRAGDELAAAQALAPLPAAQRLAEAVAAVRQADAIWNRYEWEQTIGELEKAYMRRPDLPGLREKLYAAETSYAEVLIARGAPADAKRAADRAAELNRTGQPWGVPP